MFIIILLLGIGFVTIWFFPAIIATIGHYRFSPIKTDKKIIALSFDDGPNSPYTEALLEVLSKHSVQATFFVVGKNLERFPKLGKHIMDRGHVLGNHSYSHIFFQYIKNPFFESEILKTQNVLKLQLGKVPTLYRSPWLFMSPWLMKTLNKHGLTYVSGWFGSHGEITGRSAENIAKDAVKIAKPGAILIFHDGYDAKGADRSQTVKAIDILIPKLKAEGYEFITADGLLGVKPYKNL